MSSRAYARVDDLRRMQAAVAGAFATTGLRVGDLAWLARQQTHRHLALDIRIWEDGDGRLVGWTFFRANGGFNVFVVPGHADPAFIDELLAVVDETARTAIAAGDAVDSLYTYGLDLSRSAEDRALAAALERRGFTPAPATGGVLRRGLDQLTAPVVPGGYRLATVQTPAQVLGRVEAHRASFAPSEVTLEKYEHLRRTWPYRPELDRIATTDDGTVVAFCTAWIDEENAAGLLEPVGTHPDHRRRGLERAVCLDALHALREAGARTAEVGNPRSRRTARSASRSARRIWFFAGTSTVSCEEGKSSAVARNGPLRAILTRAISCGRVRERRRTLASAIPLKRSSPEAEGIPSSAVLDFIGAVEQRTGHPLDAVQGFMLLRHGKVAAEGWWTPYGPQSPHSLYSLSKSFTASGIGLAVEEGLLTVDDPVLTFFPDEAPAHPSEHLKAMRVRHLLSMNTGHKEDTTGPVWRGEDDNWPRAFLSLPVENQPGTWFVYNTAATYMLSAIITKLTGLPLLEYLRPRLFDPLGIERLTWETDPRGVSIGGSGLHAKTEDIARFGQLYLQQGVWNGKRIVPEAWIAEATSAHSDNSNTQTNPDWTVGYGYQFWRCRHDCYRGDGAFGQFCVVMPEQDAVLAINGGLRDMQAVLDKVWEHLLPAMQPHAVPADPHAYGALCDKLAALSLPLPNGRPSSPIAPQWSGKTYELERNDLNLESVAITFGNDRATLVVHDERGAHPIQIGHGTWLKGTTDVRGLDDEPVAACGAWTAEDTYEVRGCFYEGELCLVIRCHYASGELRLDVEPNVSWGPTTVTTITGHAAGS